MKKKLVIIAIAIFVIIQFVRINTKVVEPDSNNDLLMISNAPSAIQSIIRNSCYDCHSNQTQYPWYSQVAPVSWFINHHIQEGREHFNFSNWGSYSANKQHEIINESIEEVEEQEMPLKTYTLLHSNAKLSPEKRQLLIDWFKEYQQRK